MKAFEHNTPNEKTPSLMKYYYSRDKTLLGKTEDYHVLKEQVLANGYYTYRIKRLESNHSRILVETAYGERRWCIDCASNDYLGVNSSPAIYKSVIEAIQKYGIGAQGASMLNGNTPIHFELEEALAGFLRKEATLLSSSGYASQIAAMQGLLRPKDVVFYDQLSHSSLVDGMRLSGAAMYQYPHLDIRSLQMLLKTHRDDFRGAMIVTDGVFSAEGTIAPIPDLVRLAKSYDSTLLVDDAHGIGTTNDGKGCSAYEGVDIITGTLSKALGSAGGFITGSQEIIEYLRLFGTANCATTNLSIANAAASLQALRILETSPNLVKGLQEKVRYFRSKLREHDVHTTDSCAPIVAIICGNDVNAYKAWRELFKKGVLTHALPFPIVPKGKARIRIRLNSAISFTELDCVAEKISQITEYIIQ
ncbi:MAG: aminotransferase class I/II-fold pyridoxal phosphate-dependent enzyme [Planctomycetota bacterium]|jgi:glycine C-acetyltransferase